MASAEAIQVRLVRCPKCRKLLPELPEFPVYKCGGCGSVLQAKYCKNGISVRTVSLGKSTQKNQLEQNSEDVKSNSSDQIENHCDTKECSSILNVKEQIESRKSTQKNQLEHNSEDVKSNSSDQIENHCDTKECSSVLNVKEQIESRKSTQKNQLEHNSENVKSNSSDQIENHCDTKECSSILKVKEQIESTDFYMNSSGSWKFLNGVSSDDSEGSFSLIAKERFESGYCSMKPSGRWKLLSGFSSGDSLDLDNGKEQIEPIDCSIKRSGSRSFLKEVKSGDFSYHEREEESIEVEWNTDVDENDGNQNPDAKLSSKEETSSFTSQAQSDENNPMKMSFTSSNKQLQQSHGIPHYELHHTRSIETVEASGTTDNGIISEELSGMPRDISKSPTTKSSRAYDGSVSSSDEWDDQVPEQPPNLLDRSWFKFPVVTDFASNKERPRREDGLMNKNISPSPDSEVAGDSCTGYALYNNPEVQYQLRNFFSVPLREKDGLDVMDGLEREGFRIQAQEQVGSPDSDGLHPTKNWKRSVRDEVLSRKSFQRGFPTVYENGNPSNTAHNNEFSSRKSERSGKVDYVEQMELLRMVDELRDQLSRSYNEKGMANGRFPARGTQQEKQQSPYYSSGQLDPELPHCYDANYHRNPHVPFRTTKSGFQKREFSQMHFSGQGTNFRNHVDYSSDHCCPEDWQYQTQLPPSSPCCNKVKYSGNSGHMCCEPYSSGFSLGCGKTHSNDLGYMVHDLQKKCHRDRPQPVKRHCRPIASGAPFIICYRCCELLQLPEDFISQRRVHRLRCSACSRVLKFSLQNKTHIIPYNPNLVDSLYHGSDCPKGEPVSYAEDCGPSTSKSCSPESDPPFPILQGNADDQKQPSSSHSKVKLKRKNKSVLKQSGNNCKTSIKASESASVPSNVTKLENSCMEVEVAPRLKNSPLHRLMGYSSLSKIIKR